MNPLSPGASVRKGASLICQANHVVGITGAGISTPSGIPDFRSQDSGLWELYDPMTVASLTSFRYNPGSFFEWVSPLLKTIISAHPNAAHRALAQLEEAGFLHAIITQNIDDLHFRAGSKRVFEIHGHLREASCTACFNCFDTQEPIENLLRDGKLPYCPDCGGILKPNIVLFGEQLPAEIVAGAKETLSQADLIIVVGSSLEVTPAATFPISALNRGAKLIIINHETTYLDERADVIIHDDIAEVLPKMAQAVLNG